MATRSLQSRLAPYLATLQRLESPDDILQIQDVGQRVVWLGGPKFFTDETQSEPLDRVCEALSLLSLLARVDYGTWKLVMLELWPGQHELREWINHELTPEPPFLIGLELTELSFNRVPSITRLHESLDRTTSPPSTELLPSFPHITITKMSHNSVEPVADLLELIGHGTTRLELLEYTDELSVDQWCKRVLQVCPKLEALQLHYASLDSLQFFVDAAAAGHCHLREFLTRNVSTGDRGEHVRGFFHALCDPSHPLTMQLRDLTLRLVVKTRHPNDIVEPVLKMLRQNRRLYKFHLGLYLDDSRKEHLAEYEAAFASRTEEPTVSIRLAPLAIRQKLAFLSVVDHACSRPLPFDTSVLSIVFQFAAEGRARNVRVTFGIVE